MSSQTPVKIPETMTPVEIGAYMAGLREHFKLSLQDVSERLHIRVRYVQAMEQGKADQLPGPVYARGYIHTYAEFLGLDADQVANQWFSMLSEAPVAAVVPTASTVTPTVAQASSVQMKLPSPPRVRSRNWRGIGVATVAAVAVLVVVSQMFGGDKEPAPEAQTVAPVPEDMLASVRNLVMPTPQNIDCLTDAQWLACFYADNTTQSMMRAEQVDHLLLGGDLDLSEATVAVTPPKAEDDEADAPAEKADKKDEKAAKTDPDTKADAVKKETKEAKKADPTPDKPANKPADKPADKPSEIPAENHD